MQTHAYQYEMLKNAKIINKHETALVELPATLVCTKADSTLYLVVVVVAISCVLPGAMHYLQCSLATLHINKQFVMQLTCSHSANVLLPFLLLLLLLSRRLAPRRCGYVATSHNFLTICVRVCVCRWVQHLKKKL